MMWNGSPVFVRFQRYGRRARAGGAWWWVMTPGLGLIGLALAILIWPQLLAYMVATALLFVGISLCLWGWQMRRAERRLHTSHSQEVVTPDSYGHYPL